MDPQRARLETADPASRAWVDALDPGPPPTGMRRNGVDGLEGGGYDRAVRDLHALLLRVARAEARRRTGTHGLRGVELDDLAQQAADDAVVAVLRRVGDFAGRSRFTTWAAKFAILEVSSKIGRHVWRRDGVSLDPEAWERLPESWADGVADVAEARELVGAIREVVATELTDRQRHVFEALVVAGTPIDVLSVELQMTRNAIYQSMFVVRRSLRRHLVARGLLLEGEVSR